MKVNCWIWPGLDFSHASCWLAGLLALHRARRIELTLRIPGGTESILADDPLAVAFRVVTNEVSRIGVVDFKDHSFLFSNKLIDLCDVYFKRSYYINDINVIGNAGKVRPLGLNFACRTPGLLAAILLTVMPALARSPIRSSRWLMEHARILRGIPPHRLFERSPSDPVQSMVIFQTRVWEEGETGVEPVEAINEPRVALVRALREAFGPRFRGGLIPTPLAQRYYPDAIAHGFFNKYEYIKISRMHAVAVYTRGLHHSTAWKLPEYLAASQCIVAEPPRNTLPEPLIDGKNYLRFATPNECVIACQSLLDDPEKVRIMREANHHYYLDQVAPATWVAKRLAEVIGDREAPSYTDLRKFMPFVAHNRRCRCS